MNNNAIKILSLLPATALIVAAVYFQQDNAKLETQLAFSQSQCDKSLLELTKHFESELERIQKEIDHRIAMQATTTTTKVVYTKPAEQILTESESVKPQLERYDESVEEIVRRKYRFLFARLDLSPAEMEELRLLLIEREQLALRIQDAKEFGDEAGVSRDELWDLEYQLEDVDLRIEELLNGENLQRYALLKDSDEEQKHFNQYTLGVNGLFPLNNKQQESVLLTRLRHKQRFEETIKQSGLSEGFPLTKEQSEALLKDLEMAAMRYKHSFLQEIRGELDHSNFPMDQYTMLENYTNTEFEQMMDDLRAKVQERGVIN